MPLGHLEHDQLFAGDFRVIRQLGEGGMGAVYVAEQLSTGRQRALKLMLARIAANPKSRARFIQEAQIGARVASEHVVQVITAGVDDESGTPYLVMELLDGEDLATFVERTGPMSPEATLHVFGEICHAVGAAHRAGIVHRDLKPQNVFLARSMRSDGAIVVKVLDFGIAKLLDDERGSRTTQAVGSPLWLAPEQAGVDDPVLPCTDVWSLGLIAFWMLTGKMYWRAANKSGGPGAISVEHVLTEILVGPIEEAKKRAEDFGAFGKIPDWFSPWFLGAVVRKQSSRFADGEAAFVALRDAAARAGVRAHPVDPATLGGAPSSIPVRSFPPAGKTPPTSPERPHATPDTERNVESPIATAPARPNAGARVPETGALSPRGPGGADAREVPPTRDPLPVAPPSQSLDPVERSWRTAPLPVATGEIATPALAGASSASRPTPVASGPTPMRPPRRHGKLGAIWAVLAGIVVVLGVVVAGIVIYLADVAGSDDGSHTGSPSTGTVAVPVVDPVAPTAPGTGPATLTATGDDETTTVDDVTLEPSGAPTAALVAIGADAGMRALPPTMVALPGGTFVMGCTAETARTERTACRQEGDPADCPQEVFDMEASAPATTTVGPFAIDRTEVRNELFARWLTSVRNRSVERHTIDDAPIDVVMRGSTMIAAVWAPGLDDHIGLVVEGDRIVARPGFERRPVVFVSWSGADRYCRARSRTLPTEAQWALAAGGGVRRFIVGNEPPGCDAVVRGRYEQGPCGGAPRRPENVGSTAGDVTPEGIRDLAGNVAEWVRDDFPLSVDEECGAPGQPTCRLIRGGEWESLLDRLRARSRNVAAQGTMERTLGFRCAQTL